MTMTPQKSYLSEDFPGDPSMSPPFGLKDSVRSLFLWSLGAANLFSWSLFFRVYSKFFDATQCDLPLKMMCKMGLFLAGITLEVKGIKEIDPQKAYVFASNHVNIFDMFALYSSIPQNTRALEHVEHFSWPLIGTIITLCGQIPVNPDNPRQAALSLVKAKKFLKSGRSLTVLPEGERTLDGSLGDFYSGAFKLAIMTGTPVVPIAIKGGRKISRRADLRIRPGKLEVIFGKPILTDSLTKKDASKIANTCRREIIKLLQADCL